ncbi:MAG: type II toxin-antitoxin system VapC family toxin [Rhodobacteraceae bacterium]|nr:type II toxin-antitoxin system VapC family toxin [Paracoccaceae bacterium]
MATLVVDASAVAGWLMPDEAGQDLAALADHYTDFAAPFLLWAELRNILIMGERRGRLPQGMPEQAIEAVEALGIVLDTQPSSAGVLRLARSRGLTIYDAMYLDLSLRRGADLATLDAALARAAKAEGVAVV